MTFLEDLKNYFEKLKSKLNLTDQKLVDQIPFNTDDYRYDEVLKVWIPKDVDVQNLDGIRIALSELSHSIDVDNKGINEVGSLVDSGVVEHTFEHEDLLFNTVRIIADCSSNIDLDIVIYYKNVLEDDWTEFYSESLVPADTKLNYRINISEYRDLKVKLTNNSGATLNYNVILFFSKTKFRDIKVVTPTDDLQVALDQGGIIYLSAGTHKITSALDLDQSEGVFLYGSGDASIIETVGDIKCFSITAVSSCTFSNFKIDASSLTTNAKEIIDVTEASNNMVTLENIHVTGDGSHGVGIELNTDNCRLLKCIVDNVYTGIYLRSVENVSVFQCYVNNCTAEGILSSNSDNNRIISNVSVSNLVGIQISSELGTLILGNHTKSNTTNGIALTLGSDNLVIGNFSDSNDSNTSNSQAGIYVYGLTHRNILVGNISKDNNNSGSGDSYGILIGDSDVGDTVVLGNHLDGNDVNYLDNGTDTIRFADNTAYNSTSWNGDFGTATKNAIRDQIETMITAYTALISDTSYNSTSWNGVTTIGASKNAIRDKIETMSTLIDANTTQAEVESIITAELVDGESIDNAIDSLISTHAGDSDIHHKDFVFSPNLSQDTGIHWEDDADDNTNYQDLDLDDYFTVPSGINAVLLRVHLKDDLVASRLYFGSVETDNYNAEFRTVVANGYITFAPFICPIASGNIIKVRGAVSPVDFNRIWLRVLGWITYV